MGVISYLLNKDGYAARIPISIRKSLYSLVADLVMEEAKSCENLSVSINLCPFNIESRSLEYEHLARVQNVRILAFFVSLL